MNYIPFSVYDFFGYLASGSLLIAAVDFAFRDGQIFRTTPTVMFGLLLLLVTYIVGQILAGPASFIMERVLVGKYLSRPSVNLFRDPPKAGWTKIFPGYFVPLPGSTRGRVQEKARGDGVNETGEALFVHAFGEVKRDEQNMARLNTFLNLYGFCRNVSFACLLAVIVIGGESILSGTPGKLYWASAALVGSVGMFYRYLKFFRQYSYELFITYAAAQPTQEENGAN